MNKKIIIIGGGVSGLSAGIFGRKKGFDTLIVEKNHFAGGNLTGWKRKGCYIDNCIHWLCGSKNGNRLNKLWNEVGAFENINFYQSEDFIVSEFNNLKISLNKDINVTEKNMLKLSPADKKEIKKFINAIKLITSLEKKSNIKKSVILLKLFSIYKRKTIKEVANKFKHPLLKKLLTDYFGDIFSIYVLLFAYSSFSSGDGKVIKEGSYKMAENITNKYISLGGKIKFNSEVKKVLFENKKAIGIQLNNGEQIFGDYIISTTDPCVFFKKFTNLSMPKCLEKTYKQDKIYPVISSFHIAYKINSKINIPETYVFESESTIEIATSTYNRIILRSYAYNKDFTPDDSFVLQVFLLQNEKDYEKWQSYSNEEYEFEKKRAVSEITNSILEKFPELENKVEYLDCWTPLTYTKYFGAYKGSYMSFLITNMFKLTTLPQQLKSIKNLYFASQWQRLFGGLPNALNSGKSCIEKIEKQI